MVPHVSYSAWQLFRSGCQWRWKLDYLEGRRKQNYGVHMDFGTACHLAVEKHRTRKDPVTLEQAIVVFEEEFKRLHSENLDKYKEKDREIPIEFFLGAGRNILTRFHECEELATAEVVYNEHELYVPIDRNDDVKVNFKGFIDMVIKTTDRRGNTILYVCDFKTCSWGWPRQKREDKELHFQILLYKHFLCKKFNLDPKMVRTAFVLLKKKPQGNSPPVEWFPLSAGPVSVQRALDAMNADITEMAERSVSGDFKKNRDECHNKFGDTCVWYGTPECTKD